MKGIPLFDNPPPPKEKPQEPDWLMESLYSFLRKTYAPIEVAALQDSGTSVEYMTTLELYEMLQHIYPEPPIGPNDLAHWLQQEGYSYTHTEHKIYWILKHNA